VVLEQEERPLDDIVEVDPLLARLLGPAEIEEAVDDLLAAHDLLVDDVEEVLRLGRDGHAGAFQVLHPVAERLGASGDRRERIVDLVHDAGPRAVRSPRASPPA
jgi:hypothetical protein